MTWLRLVRAELRKLTTTRMPWGFVAVLVLVAVVNAVAILSGTDMDGTKDFIATAADQRSLLAFGANALIVTGLFGAIAAAREYGHGTVVPTFLTAPRRHVGVLAQLAAILLAGALLGLVGGALVATAGIVSIPLVDYEVLLSTATIVRLLAVAAVGGASGAVLGAGIANVVRNAGGTVAVVVLVLFIAPPLLVQLISEAASWVPAALVSTLSGVSAGPAPAPALAALAAWALLPAAIGLGVVQRRDVI